MTEAKIDQAAQEAYAKAASAAESKPASKKAATKPAAKKAAASKKTAASKKAAPKKVTGRKAAPKKAATAKPAKKAKETIMAKTETADFADRAKEVAADAQTRAKELAGEAQTRAKEFAADAQTRVKGAYDKAGEYAAGAGEFNKANLDAVVESGKILFAGAKDIVKSDIETGKTVASIVSEDAKKLTAVKSASDLVALQGEVTKRNLDAVVSFGSARAEALVKLYNDAFAPISNRVSVAAEKISKAA